MTKNASFHLREEAFYFGHSEVGAQPRDNLEKTFRTPDVPSCTTSFRGNCDEIKMGLETTQNPHNCALKSDLEDQRQLWKGGVQMAEEEKGKGGIIAGIIVVVIAIVGAVGYLIHHMSTGQM